MLYKDEYTSGNDVRIDPQRSQHRLRRALAAAAGILSRTARSAAPMAASSNPPTAARHWTQLTRGLPSDHRGQPGHRPQQSQGHLRHGGGGAPWRRRGSRRRQGAAAAAARRRRIAFYKSTDGGEHWFLATDDPRVAETGSQRHPPDPRPLGRIGGGDLPTITVDPKNENVVYSCSTVFWRTEDGGLTWSAVRGAPGGDDYQKSWVNPNNPNIILLVSDQGGVVSANRGESWSNWYTQPTAAMYHVTADNAFPYRLCGGQQDSGSACVDSRGMDGEITFHDWHPVGIEEYGEAAPDPKNPDLVYGGKVIALQPR